MNGILILLLNHFNKLFGTTLKFVPKAQAPLTPFTAWLYVDPLKFMLNNHEYTAICMYVHM